MSDGPQRVAVVRCPDYGHGTVEGALERGLELLGGWSVRAGERVLVKPNLVRALRPERAHTTHPSLIRALCRLLAAEGARVSVGDNPVMGLRRLTYQRTGMTRAVKGTGARLIDLSEAAPRPCPDGRVVTSLNLSTAVSRHDVVLNVPKLKAHPLMILSGAVKNSFGLVQGPLEQKRLHFHFPEVGDFARMLLDLDDLVRPGLSVVDAVEGYEGQHHGSGRARRVGFLVLGMDSVAVDWTLARLVGLSPSRVGTLEAAAKEPRHGDLERTVEPVGDWDSAPACPDYEFPAHPTGIVRSLPSPVSRALVRGAHAAGRRER